MGVARIAGLVGILGCSVALLACGSVGRPPAATQSRDPLTHPLRMPVVDPGASCPASPQVTVPAQSVGYAFGRSPVYLSGQLRWYAGRQVALILVDSTYSGPLLVRARRLDGKGTATLSNAEVSSAGKLGPTIPQASPASGGVELQVSQASSPGTWQTWQGNLTISQPGCYGLQLDGTTFSTVVVFDVLPGPVPPA
ncbi:MAG: hypothetical protein J2P28_24570 [Actinobacteria bacterium]|nr:hypothetical protein [Actinomycetota bacterium]